MPKISVIIPVYNPGNYIRTSSSCVLASTLSDIELILVDDGCKDNGGATCDEIQREDTRVKVIHKQNGGISSARNAGIKAATGDYLAFVDQDDTISPEMYETLYDKTGNGDVDVSFCDFDITYPDRTEIYRTYDVHENHIDTYKDMLLHGYGGQIWNMIIKRSLVVENGFYFPEHLRHCEDTYFSRRCHLVARKYAKTAIPLYHYNMSNMHNVSNNLDFRFTECSMQCIDETIEYLKEHGAYETYSHEYEYLILQTKTSLAIDRTKYSLLRSWHPEAVDYIQECPLLGSMMKKQLILIHNGHDTLAAILSWGYKTLRKH